MLTEAPERRPADSAVAPPPGPARPVWWARLLARLPLPALYALAAVIGWLCAHVYPYRQRLVRENLARAFPDYDAARLRAVMAAYYHGFAQMLVEIVKSTVMTPAEFAARVRAPNLELARAYLRQGQPVLLVAAHQCNWEWMLLALSVELGFPVDAAYKPLVNRWAETEMKKIRTRFGSRLVPAQELLADIIRRRGVVRAVAMVADQEPTSSERKHWTRFLNRDTAFYMGPEEIARVTRFPTFFIGLKRLARGRYEMQLTPLAAPAEKLAPGELTERYVALVEAQIRAAPPDWPWSHKRWKLKKNLYQARA
ncbi:MAG: lysophospholipid acyltransferase family protein [Gammaproteobacteria bacterium]|nr:lysophospholipid acyltransferase family protein [Gammaproteobacteria bacterium]